MLCNAVSVAFYQLSFRIQRFYIELHAVPRLFARPIAVNQHVSRIAFLFEHQHHLVIRRKPGWDIICFVENFGDRSRYFQRGFSFDFNKYQTVSGRPSGRFATESDPGKNKQQPAPSQQPFCSYAR